MKKIRRAKDRGHLNFGWLDANHTFSFGSYFDPDNMGFRSLRVMNNDRIEPAKGFDTHPHKNMEIITFITEGELAHKDTLGNSSVIKPGEIQIMSAGTGIFHSEYNASNCCRTCMYQIWIKPSELGVEPRYEQYSYEERVKINDLTVLASPNGGETIAKIYQEATVSLGRFIKGGQKHLELNPSKGYWFQVVKGNFTIGDDELSTADGICFEEESSLDIIAKEDGEFLLFELA